MQKPYHDMAQLKPIKPKRISDQVYEQLRELIFRGEFKPGDKILTERELSKELNVSRTSVRDAINKLVVMGLLEQKQGQGTFVRSPELHDSGLLAQAMESQDATLEDLLEVRMGMECNAAAFAAQRANDKDIAFLKKSLEEMRAEVKDGRLGTEADVAFHMAISYATHNPVQVYLMKRFYDFLFHGIRENLLHLYERPKNVDLIIYQHEAIFETIQAHDPDKAYHAMKDHISYVLNFFKERPPRHH
jgi:GntR family transcriptional repressor for pyruvate dehydrogenase complex